MKKFKVFIAKILLSNPIGFLIQILTRDKISFRGIVVPTDDNEVSLQIKSQLFFGLYEKQEAVFVQKFLPRHLPVVELGSSLGVITSLAARKIDKTIIAIEVNPRLIEVIKRTLNSNGVTNCLLLNFGIGDDALGNELFFNLGHNNTSGYISKSPQSGSTSVPVKKLSSIVTEYGLGEYSLLCDIEGSETAILFDDPISLSNCRFLIMELHRTNVNGIVVTVEDLMCRLEVLGFEIIQKYGPVIVARKN